MKKKAYAVIYTYEKKTSSLGLDYLREWDFEKKLKPKIKPQECYIVCPTKKDCLIWKKKWLSMNSCKIVPCTVNY